MKVKEQRKALRDKSEAELGEELLKLRREQFNLRMQAATGQGAKPDQHGKVRRSIARLKTVQHERAKKGEK
jgi:large subunit ribosomal protein L29